ncbi:T9SS type A sorting domain-containing protein [Aridibaculum aurantiacum]|uniref:T9SS type A sorting domain-containing protein n=1 Tax=Aridibaculum aurantiacum TaxID=2810307 RepID=UPI001A96278A|nr:T9SS type A sorting domain-containing protein [Aridibaculum aurantiacum]
MKRGLLFACMLSAMTSFGQSFTPGNLVVYRYGDGQAALPASTTVPVYLDEYTPTGTLVRTRVIPTTDNGANHKLTGIAKLSNGTYQQEGISTLSQDGKYITIFGYNQAPGGVVPATSDAFVVGIVAADGSYNSTTTLSNEPTVGLGSPRSAVTKDNNIWANGFQNGVRYTTLGSNTSTRVSTQQNAPRTLTMFNDALYAPIGNSANLAVADPAPTTSTTFTTHAVSAPTPTANQVALFYVGGRLRLYIADDGATTGSTIRRYYMKDAGSTWVADGTISTASTAFVKSVVCVASESGSNTVVDVYATTWGNDGNGTESSKLLHFQDTYVTASPKNAPSTTPVTVLATAPSNTLFRSVTLAPINSSSIGTAILPLSLKSFNAAVDGKHVKIWWNTTNEVNTKDFTIERSADAVSFERIGTQVANNRQQENAYSFIDFTNTHAVVYYRLKMNDKDGKFSFSPVIRVALNKINKTLSVAPNPVVGSSMNVSHDKAGKGATLKVVSLDGRVMQSMQVQEGATQTVVLLNQLSKGNYIVELSDASGKQITTIVKQ